MIQMIITKTNNMTIDLHLITTIHINDSDNLQTKDYYN